MKLAPTLLPCFLIFAPFASQAEEVHWSNLLSSGYFDNAAHWSPMIAPAAMEDVIFGHVGYPQFGEIVIRNTENGAQLFGPERHLSVQLRADRLP